MQLKTKVIGAAGIAAVVGAGGFAFTASSSLPNSSSASYGSVTASGGTINNLAYTFSANGTTISTATFDVSLVKTDGATVRAGFDSASLVDCTVTGAWTPVLTPPDTGDVTSYSHSGVSCPFTTANTTASIAAFHVLIGNGTPLPTPTP